MRKVIGKPFFNRATLVVARDLLGKYIVRNYRGKEIAVMITEVEAYDGPFDLASHAGHGLSPKTGRASVMFGDAGYFYIFFTYGVHWMINVVTGPKNYPAAILLRGGVYKNPKTDENVFINGPARLAKFLHIDKTFNTKPAIKKTGLWFENRGEKTFGIVKAKRVGVDYAGPIWGEKKYNLKLDRAAGGYDSR